MKTLSKSEYKALKQVFKLGQGPLLLLLERYLEQLYSKERVVNDANKFVYAIGDVPILLVAHLDTVHYSAPSEFFYDRQKNVIWSPQGLGADDRAGVYAILRILAKGHRPYVLFTTDEERGGIGASYVTSIGLRPDVNFVIELDRQGTNDSVFYNCENESFEDYVNKYGFTTDLGTFSDISILCPYWGIAGVNLSIGYRDEHTRAERLYVGDMLSTIIKVEAIIKTFNPEKDKFIYIRGARKSSFYSSLDNWWDSSGVLDKYCSSSTPKKQLDEICYGCFEVFHPDMIIRTDDGNKYCGDCYGKLYTTCTKCNKSFKDITKTHLLCENCRKEETE